MYGARAVGFERRDRYPRHVDPDSMPRSIDAIDLARLAKQRGMRGLVLKIITNRRPRWPTLSARKCPGSKFLAASTSTLP